jgi:hypothetical protein
MVLMTAWSYLLESESLRSQTLETPIDEPYSRLVRLLSKGDAGLELLAFEVHLSVISADDLKLLVGLSSVIADRQILLAPEGETLARSHLAIDHEYTRVLPLHSNI